MAARYAIEVGGTVDTEIVQTNRAQHTGANAMERIVSRPSFDSPVEKGRPYVLVDDVVTLGGTLAEAANYIQEQGGKIAGSLVLVNASRTATLAPSRGQIKLLEERHGNEIREIFNVEPAALTAAEASYLVSFKSAETLRNRAAAAVEENRRRARAYTNQEEDLSDPLFKLDDDQTETVAFKEWFGDSKVVDKDGKPLVVYHFAFLALLEKHINFAVRVSSPLFNGNRKICIFSLIKTASRWWFISGVPGMQTV